MDVERLIGNLMVLGRLDAGERVSAREGRLYTCPAGPLTALRRWFRSETRGTALHVLETLVESSVEMCGRLSETEEQGEVVSVRDFLARAQRDSRMQQLVAGMVAARGGLERLSVTYTGDVSTVSRLEVLAKKLESVTDALQKSSSGR